MLLNAIFLQSAPEEGTTVISESLHSVFFCHLMQGSVLCWKDVVQYSVRVIQHCQASRKVQKKGEVIDKSELFLFLSPPAYRLFTVMQSHVLLLCSVPSGRDALRLWVCSTY